MENNVAANVLGVTGAICWSVQLIPQIILNYRRHHARGLQSSMMLLWACAGIPLGIYNVTREVNVALQVQPQILTTLSLVTWAQCRYYKKGWSIKKCITVVTVLGAVMGGIEAGCVFALRGPVRRGTEWPMTLVAILSAIFLSAGIIRHYYDIYQHRSVRGISFLFVGIDAAGDLTSLLSLLFEPHFDVRGCIIYATELTLWIGIMGCGLWYGRNGRGAVSEADPFSAEMSADESRRREETPSIQLGPIRSRSSAVSVFHRPSSLHNLSSSDINVLSDRGALGANSAPQRPDFAIHA